MHARWMLATIGSLLWVGCHGDPDPPPLPHVPRAAAPLRGAAGDADLRVMLSEIASAQACAMIKGQFRPLRAPDRRDTVTGILWIRDCEIVNRGTRVTFRLTGNGWQWAEQTAREAGGTLAVRQYVKFGVDVELPGSIDLAYDVRAHVASLWFSLSADPAIDFAPLGEVEVDAQGAWSSVIGGVSSLFASAPEERAARHARHRGTRPFEHELSDGMALTLDLCTGVTRFGLGRPPKGAMQPADAGEARPVPIELQPGGLMLFGPQPAPDGMTIRVDAEGGAVRVALVCADKAEQVAQAYLEGALGDGPLRALATADVRSSARLHVAPQRCPVVVIARSLDEHDPVTFAWQRPQGEAARATGRPLIHCGGARSADPVHDKPADSAGPTPIKSADTTGARH